MTSFARLAPTAFAAPVLIMTLFSLWRHSLLSWPRPPLRTDVRRYGHLTVFIYRDDNGILSYSDLMLMLYLCVLIVRQSLLLATQYVTITTEAYVVTLPMLVVLIFMVTYVIGQTIIFLPVISIFFLSSFFPRLISASVIGCLPYFHTWCGISANLECMSEMCCTRLAENTGRKKSPFWHHRTTL